MAKLLAKRAAVSGRNLSNRQKRFFVQKFGGERWKWISAKWRAAEKQIIHRAPQQKTQTRRHFRNAAHTKKQLLFAFTKRFIHRAISPAAFGFREAHRGQSREKSSSFSHYLCTAAPTRAVPLLSLHRAVINIEKASRCGTKSPISLSRRVNLKKVPSKMSLWEVRPPVGDTTHPLRILCFVAFTFVIGNLWCSSFPRPTHNKENSHNTRARTPCNKQSCQGRQGA